MGRKYQRARTHPRPFVGTDSGVEFGLVLSTAFDQFDRFALNSQLHCLLDFWFFFKQSLPSGIIIFNGSLLTLRKNR